MNNAKWHGPAKNPLAVALEVAQVYGCSGRLYATISAIARWEIFDEKDFIEDLLQGKRPTSAVLPEFQQSGLISSVNSPASHARAMAASRRVRSW